MPAPAATRSFTGWRNLRLTMLAMETATMNDHVTDSMRYALHMLNRPAALPDAPALTEDQYSQLNFIHTQMTKVYDGLPYERKQDYHCAVVYLSCILDSFARRPVAQASQSTVQPFIYQEADGDVVEQIAKAIFESSWPGYNNWTKASPETKVEMRKYAEVAAAVARQHFAVHPPEGWRTTEQVQSLLREGPTLFAESTACARWINDQLTAPKKPTPQERVTISGSVGNYCVLLDGLILRVDIFGMAQASLFADGVKSALALADKGGVQ